MSRISKYSNSEILIQTSQSSNDPEPVRKMLEELDTFENEVSVLMDDLAKVDKSIAGFKKSCDDVAENVNNLGSAAADIFAKGDSKVKGAVALAASAIKIYGYFSSKQKESAARKEYYAQKDALLQKKQETASLKLPTILKQFENFKNNISVRFEKLYLNDLNKTVDISDKLALAHASLFRRNFSLVIKSRFLMEVMQYCIAEMQAWSNGKQDSDLSYPSVQRLIENEFRGWTDRLGFKNKEWDEMMVNVLNQTDGTIPLPLLMVIVDPCLMRHFIGINIGDADNCPDGLIQINSDDYECSNPIANQNPYLTHCRSIYAQDYNPPRYTMGAGLWDYLIILAVPFAFFIVLSVIFILESSAFWRIFFILPALCWLGLGIEHLETNYDDIFPYVKRIKEYNFQVDTFLNDIKLKENCKEFHMI